MVGLIVPETPLAGEGLAIDVQLLPGGGELGLGGEAGQVCRPEAGAEQQAPGGAEVVLDFHLLPRGVCLDGAVAGLTQEGPSVHLAEDAANGRDAAVEGRLLAGDLQVVGDGRILAQAEPDGGQEAVALGADRPPEALGLVVEADQTGPEDLPGGEVDVSVRPAGAVAPKAGAHGAAGLTEPGLAGDDVHGASGLAAAEEGSVGAFQDLDALHAGDVPGSAKAAPAIEAVYEIAAGQVLVPGEAAHRIGVPEAAEIILPGDPGVEV